MLPAVGYELTDAALAKLTALFASPDSYRGGQAPAQVPTGEAVVVALRALEQIPAFVFEATSQEEGGSRYTAIVGDVEAVLGLTREAVMARFTDEVAHPDDLERLRSEGQAAFREGRFFETALRAAPVDDEERWLYNVARFEARADGRVGSRGVLVRSEAFGALRRALDEQTTRLADVTDSIPGVVYQWHLAPDGEFRVPYMSEGSRDMLGIEAEELMARAQLTNELVLPDDLPRVHESVARSAITLEPWELTYRVRLPDGQLKTLFGTGTPRRLPDGSTLWNSVTIDITEVMRRSEARLAEERLQSEQQRAESLGRLAGGIAHDVNNFLVGVLSNADLLQSTVGASVEARQLAADIEAGARLCADLIAQILQFAGQTTIHREPVALAPSVEETLRLLHRTGDGAAVSVEEDPAVVFVDRSQLRRIVMNLVTNALEASEPSPSVRISFHDAPLEEVRALAPEATGSFVRMAVEDDGAGMDADTRERIFEPFFSTKPTGRGLGLSTTAGMVRAHGGAMRVVSRLGEGTRIDVYLPRAIEGAAAEEEASPPQPEPRALRVLVVDDQPTVRTALQRLFEREGWATVVAASGDEALRQIAGGSAVDCAVDCAVLDVRMPGMDGLELFDELRERLPSLPIAFCSGFADDRVGRLLEADPTVRFVAKPFSPRQLVATLRELARSDAEGAYEP